MSLGACSGLEPTWCFSACTSRISTLAAMVSVSLYESWVLRVTLKADVVTWSGCCVWLAGSRKRQKDGVRQCVSAETASEWVPGDQHDLPARTILAVAIERHEAHRVWIRCLRGCCGVAVVDAPEHGGAGKRSAAERSDAVHVRRHLRHLVRSIGFTGLVQIVVSLSHRKCS